MNKLLVSFFSAATMFTLTGCDMMARPAVTPVATPTPVVTASAPAPAATAAVVCDETKSATSIANGDGARAAASCGKKAVVAKAVKPAPAQKTVVASTGDSEMVRALAVRNAELKAQLANRQAGAVVASDAITVAAVGKFAPAPSYATEGRVYSDAGGNTFQRIKGGDRLCRFYVQGELRKEQFVSGPTPEATHEMCNNLAMVFQASLTPTTPDAKVEAVLK